MEDIIKANIKRYNKGQEKRWYNKKRGPERTTK